MGGIMGMYQVSSDSGAFDAASRVTLQIISAATGRNADYCLRAPKGSLFAEHRTHSPLDVEVSGLQDHVLVYHVGGCTDVAMSIRGRIMGTRARVGSVTLMPANTEMTFRIARQNEVMHLYLKQQLLDEYCRDRYGALHCPELRDFFAIDDRWLQSFFTMLQAECAWVEHPQGDVDTLFLDQAQQMLVRHMVEHYSDLGSRQHGSIALETAVGRIRAATVRRICDFIEARLAEDIHLKDLAAIACQSEDHFIRAFRLTVGCTPYQYLLARRVQRARSLLDDTSFSISDVAGRAGFKSSCYFSATFRRYVGMSPRAYRERVLSH